MKIPIFKPDEVIRILKKHGFVVKRQTGSHVIPSANRFPKNEKVPSIKPLRQSTESVTPFGQVPRPKKSALGGFSWNLGLGIWNLGLKHFAKLSCFGIF
jgi:predicted RNA binding protein YcfA (HicA-like mRNA interferase family)